jgi:hypothetical protein
MRSLLRSALAVALLIGTAAGAATEAATEGAPQTSTPQPPPSGALEPQSTSPLGGATPQAQGAPPAAVTPPANVVAPPLPGRVFASEQGLIISAIKPDKVSDFETVISKLREALASSKDPVRNQQGWGWKIFKASEPGPNNTVLYVFVMDPVVKNADYGIAKILAEAYPAEIADLYRMYSGAFAPAGQTLLNLKPIAPPAPGDAATKTPPLAGASTTPATAPQ